MHAGSWESIREAFEWHEAKPSASLASRVLSKLPKCIHDSIDAQPNHGPFRSEHYHCHFVQYVFFKNTRELIKYKIFLNSSECFYWLNTSTRFNRRTGVGLSKFS